MKDEHYMQRALELAKKGLGTVSPNPMVGCVIVHKEKIIGEGWHIKYGESHAEVNAINAVQDKSLLVDSTIYITLEPCSYHGKTPACADLLIRSNVKKVVIATLDPNPKVSGNGIAALKNAGIETLSGVLNKEAIELNKRFFINQALKRPYIILKWAQTQDGFIARANFDSKWISNEFSRQLVHQWRAEEDAILVGKNTAHYDNPSLTVREWHGENPVRVVLDRNLELNSDLNLFDGEVKTLIYNCIEDKVQQYIECIKLDKEDFIRSILDDLYQRDIGSLIVEGGAQVLNNFIRSGFWDEARVFTSNEVFEDGIKAPKMEEKIELVNEKFFRRSRLNDDDLSYYFNSKTKGHWQKN